MTARNAAVAALLADLREELVIAPSEPVRHEHVRMMHFEAQLVEAQLVEAQASATTGDAGSARPQSSRARVELRVRRAIAARPRRAAALITVVCVVSGSIGLNAAGALPGAVRDLTQHITDSIVHVFGVPQAPGSGSDAASGAPGSIAIDGAPSSTAPRATSPATPTSAAPGTTAHSSSSPSSTGAPTPTTAASEPVTQQSPSGSQPVPPGWPTAIDPPVKPIHKDMGKDPGAPAGFPADWQALATVVAGAQLTLCARVHSPAPAGCPQHLSASNVVPGSVRWTLLNQTLSGATVTVGYHQTPGHRATTQVFVYGLFQMKATYTVAGDDKHPRYAYSGGVAQAMMSWDGSSYENVSFTSGSVTDHPPAGFSIPSFGAPPVDDGTVRAAVLSGLEACAAATAFTVPNCPQRAANDPTAKSPQWSLVGDPMLGSVVDFDTQHGNFMVTGWYTMTLSSVGPTGPKTVSVTAQYAATLAFDGDSLQLIAISGS